MTTANAPDRHVQDPNDFLMGGGVPSASFKNHGDSIGGTICEPAPYLQQQRDYTTNEPKVWEDGNPMMHLVVTLQTDDHDSEIEDDDGRRRIYVKANLKRAVSDAVRKAKAKQLDIGGGLVVTYTKDGEATKKGMQPPKLYEATYTPPGAAFLGDGKNEDDGFGDESAAKPTTVFANLDQAVAYMTAETKGKMTRVELVDGLKAAGLKGWNAEKCSPVVVNLVSGFIPF